MLRFLTILWVITLCLLVLSALDYRNEDGFVKTMASPVERWTLLALWWVILVIASFPPLFALFMYF